MKPLETKIQKASKSDHLILIEIRESAVRATHQEKTSRSFKWNWLKKDQGKKLGDSHLMALVE